jgi:hypothetical protein
MFRLNYKKSHHWAVGCEGKNIHVYSLSGFNINYVVYLSRLNIVPANQASYRQTDTTVLRGSVTPLSISINNGRNLKAIKTKSRRGVTLHKEKSNKMQQCINFFIIPYLYEAQHVVGGRCQAHCA